MSSCDRARVGKVSIRHTPSLAGVAYHSALALEERFPELLALVGQLVVVVLEAVGRGPWRIRAEDTVSPEQALGQVVADVLARLRTSGRGQHFTWQC
jgi:hypothetical protein